MGLGTVQAPPNWFIIKIE